MNHLPVMTHQDAGKRMLSVRPLNFNGIVTQCRLETSKKAETFLLKDAMKKYVKPFGPSLSGTTVQGYSKNNMTLCFPDGKEV